MTTPTRAVGCIRLSRLHDASTSPERQREVIQRWSEQHETPLVHIAEDLDVSGSVNPFERDELGPWLTDTPPSSWTVLVAWRLDRVSRSALDTLQLLEWLEARGKRLVTIDDGIDTGTSMGRLFVQIAGIFAQLERETIRERTLASRQALRASGRWGGEAIPYGYKAAKDDSGGYRLVPDEPAAEIVRRIFDRYLDGQSVARITRDLQSDGVLAPRDRQRFLREQELKGDQWAQSTVYQMLGSRSVLGWTVHKGEADPSIPKAEPIVSSEVFQRAQVHAEKRSTRTVHVPRKTSSPLAGVAICKICFRPLHIRRQTMPAGRGRMKTTTVYRYYYCSRKCFPGQIKADELEDMCLRGFLYKFADEPVLEPVEHPASDHSEELANVRLIIEDLAGRLGQTQSDAVRKALGEQLEQLGNKEAELSDLPVESARVEMVPTGRTWGEEMANLDEYGKRDMWLRVGYTFAVSRNDDGKLIVAIREPGEDRPLPGGWFEIMPDIDQG